MTRRDAVLLLGGALLAAVALRDGVAPHDEGLMLAWAQRVSDGQLPYRDFWCNYGPGQPLALGALTAVVGPSLLAWRIVRVLVGAIAAWLAYRLVADETRELPGGGHWALGAWAASAGMLAWPLLPAPTVPALALGLGALWLARRRPAWAGVLAGAAGLWRPELGVAFAIATVWRAGAGQDARRAATAATATFVAGWAPFLALAGGDVAGQVLGFVSIQSQQRLPFPPPYDGGLDPNKLLEGNIALLLVAGVVLWVALRRGPAWLAVPLLGGLAYLLGRADEFHLLPLGVLVAVGLAIAGARATMPLARVAVAGTLAILALHGVDRQAGRLLHPGDLAAVPGPAGDGVRTFEADAAALGVLRKRLGGTRAPLLVLPPRTDRVTVGDPLLNVVLDRPNPTRYDVMQPGVVTTAKVQREVIGDLRAARPPQVVRWLGPEARRREPNASGRERGATLLDGYVATHYAHAFRTGDYEVLTLRPGA
jgi:hypothetical protein